MEGTPLRTSAVKRTALASLVPRPNSARIDAAADADGNADQAGEAEKSDRADDGVGHAAAGLAYRLGNLGEEVEIQRAGALDDEVDEDCHQRQNDQERRQHRQTSRGLVDEPAEPRTQFEFLLHCSLPIPFLSHCRSVSLLLNVASAGAPRVTAQTSRRAIAFTMMVTINSARPISISALRCMSLTASVNSLAMTEAIELAVGQQRAVNLRGVADDHGDGHGFAQRAAQAENDGAHDADARIAQHAHANHLPARGAQGQHRFALRVGHGGHHFARERGDDGQDHDGENDGRRRNSRGRWDCRR